MAAGDVPPYHELLLPALQAVGELGGSASISEIVETVVKCEGFSDAQQAVLHNDGPETEIGYRLAWARAYLKGMGLLTNSSRGVWALTDDGTGLLTDPSATDDQRSERIQELRARYLTETHGDATCRPGTGTKVPMIKPESHTHGDADGAQGKTAARRRRAGRRAITHRAQLHTGRGGRI